MKNAIRILSLFCMVSLVTVCCYGNASLPYKITSELISIELEVPEETIEAEATPIEVPPHAAVDLSNAMLTISYESINAEGEAETTTLYEGAYQEFIANVVQLTEPTELKIELQVTEEADPMTINTVIGTGSDVHFAYIDRPGPRDEFLLVGSTNQVTNPENKFSVSGDLSFLDIDSSNMTLAFAYATFVNADGERQSKQWGPVLVKDNSFLIEGDVDRPIQARLYVSSGRAYSTSTQIILEPQGDLKVAKLGDQTQAISATSDAGYHAILIDSWQQSEEYIALAEAYVTEYELFHNPSENTGPTSEPHSKIKEDSDDDTVQGERETEDDSQEAAIVNDSVHPVENIAPAQGCEDAVLQESTTTVAEQDTPPTRPRWIVLREETSNFQTKKLQDIAKNHTDPIAQLLAMEMGAFSPVAHAEEALAVWRGLAEKFDDDFAATYVTPDLERVEQLHTLALINEALIPGQKVPEFTLANLDGEDIAIYDLVGDKDIVLIDFWASWCGPCIETFPDLKKLHAAYTDENFEIVGVSIDNNLEDWSGGVDEHELPWVQLGELKDANNESPVSKNYGVNSIPKTFLVDSQGCIYRKNIHPDELKTFLVDRYGMDKSLEEAEEETEDSPDVPS